MTQDEIGKFLTEAYETCSDISNIERSDVVGLLEYQTVLMGLLARSAEVQSEAEYYVRQKQGEIINSPDFRDMAPNKAKMVAEQKSSLELRTWRLAERLNRTITHLLDSLNVKIPNERKLLPGQ